MSKTIIRNYVIDQGITTPSSPNDQKIPRIIKTAFIEKERTITGKPIKKQNTAENTEKEKKNSTMEINRNKDGIVISIDLICSCGEKHTIKLEY